MKSRRLGLLSVVAVALAGLVLVDRSISEEPASDVATAVRNTPTTTVAAQMIATPDDDTRLQARNPLASLSLDGMSQTIERPLFSASRRPPVKVAPARKRTPAPPPRPRVKRNHFKLLGVIGGGPRENRAAQG